MTGNRLKTLAIGGCFALAAAGCRSVTLRPADCLAGLPRWPRAETALAPPSDETSHNQDRPEPSAPATSSQTAGSPSHMGEAAEPSAPAPQVEPDPGVPAGRRLSALSDLKSAGARVSADESGQIIAVDLAQSSVSDEDLESLLELPQLRELNLRETLVSDAGIATVAHLQELEFLGLTGTLVTDAGLVHLPALHQLRFLTLGHTIITDAGLDLLADCERLEAINLKGTAVTAEGITRFLELRPDCRVVSDIAGFGATETGDPADDSNSDSVSPGEPSADNDSGDVSFPDGHQQRFGIPLPPGASEDADRGRLLPADDPFQPAPSRDANAASIEHSDYHLAESSADPQERLMLILRDKLEDPEVLRAIADVYASQNQWQDARKVLQAAVERSPRSSRLNFELAVVEARCGDYVSALAHFERSVGTAQAHYNLGVLLQEAGMTDASVYEFQQALEHDPKLTEARQWLVYLNHRAADESRRTPVLSDEEIRGLIGATREPPRRSTSLQQTSFGVDIRPGERR